MPATSHSKRRLLLPGRGVVILPGEALQLKVGRERSLAVIREALAGDRHLVLVPQREAQQEVPSFADLRAVGTVCEVLVAEALHDGSLQVDLLGKNRCALLAGQGTGLPDWAEFSEYDYPEEPATSDALLVEAAAKMVLTYQESKPAWKAVSPADSSHPGVLADRLALLGEFAPADRQALLEMVDPLQRLRHVLALHHKAPSGFRPEQTPDYLARLNVGAREIGCCIGLVVGESMGHLMLVEATCLRGSGKLMVTGHPGESMVDAAYAALTCIRSRAEDLQIAPGRLDAVDLHLHLAGGALKVGSSAGAAMAAALASVLTGRPLRCDAAVTGEITPRGRVLRVGGLAEKVSAAQREGCRTVVVPAGNRADVDSLPDAMRGSVMIHVAATVDDVLRLLMEGPSESDEERRR